MPWRSLLIAAGCLTSVSAQYAGSLSDTLADTGIIPAGLEDIVAEFVLGKANSTSIQIEDALAQPGVEELKRTDPEAFYAGQSPAVYPSRGVDALLQVGIVADVLVVAVNAGLGDWDDAYTKARAMVAQMTNEEKNNVCLLGLYLR